MDTSSLAENLHYSKNYFSRAGSRLLTRSRTWPHLSWLVVALAIITVVGVVLAQILGLSTAQKTADYLQDFHGQIVTLSGTVVKDPVEGDRQISYVLANLELATTAERPTAIPLTGQLYVTFSSYSASATPADLTKTTVAPARSDRLTLSGELQAGFGTYVASLKNPTITQLDRLSDSDFFLQLRNAFAAKIRDFIPSPESGLELGYLLGMKTEVDADFEAILRIVGLTHIIVASGTHLGILVGVSRKLFGKLSRFAGFLAATLLIIIFVGITGLTPSMLRASFVSGLMLIVWYFGRDADPWRVLLYAAAITLAIDPANLNNLAWQLSFGSFSGLMLVSPVLTRFFYGEKSPGFFGSSLITSVSTMLCCAPILLYSFGSLSLISVLANLLILPTLAPAMGLGLATGLFGLLGLAPLATVAGWLTTLILDYHIFIVNQLGAQTSFLITLESNNPLVFLLWLLPLTLIITSQVVATFRHSVASAAVLPTGSAS